MGVNWTGFSLYHRPTLHHHGVVARRHGMSVRPRIQAPPAHPHDVVVQGEFFDGKGLKPGFHLIGSMVETRRFQAMGQLDSTCTAPP
jgi:hypothetical protein